MKKWVYFLMILSFIFLLTGCIPGDGSASVTNEAGFFWGIWHGWIAPVSLIISLFNNNISIYEVHNIGFWYNFGFYIAIIGGFGGFSLFRNEKKRRKKDHKRR